MSIQDESKLTPCCQALATFHDYTLVCKGCYDEVSLEYA